MTIAPGATPWRKAGAVAPVVSASRAAIIVIADADCLCDGLPEAVKAVEEGAPWAIPHAGVFRLTEASTERVYDGAFPEGLELEQRAYRGYAGGGFVVAPRETLIDIPLDPRFEGWGQEDESWAMALNTLAGQAWRGKSPLFHLWHPPQERLTRKHGSIANNQLFRRYRSANGKPASMRALIEGIEYERFGLDQPRLHDPAPR